MWLLLFRCVVVAVTIFVGICVVVVVVALIFVVADGVSVLSVFVLSFFWRGVLVTFNSIGDYHSSGPDRILPADSFISRYLLFAVMKSFEC